MILYLFTKDATEPFAELTAPIAYVGKDPANFMKKKAKEYAKIRGEFVVVRAEGLPDASAS
jgi:hypothetical protein